MSESRRNRPPLQRDVNYENFADYFVVNYSATGTFLVDVGQAVFDPPKVVMRIWMDAKGAEVLMDLLRTQLENHKKTLTVSEKGSSTKESSR